MTFDPPHATTRDPARVREMFGRLARRYDFANHFLSGGVDFWWRARAARMVASWRPAQVLDLATGSGDLALALQRRLPGAEIMAADFSPEMLALARRKGVRETMLADALELPFAAGQFDAVTVGFGLRNMRDWRAALLEMKRVLRPGGRLLVLDFSTPHGWLRPVYRVYLHRLLPLAAALVTGEKTAYEYLAGSIEIFPSGERMLEMLGAAGFVEPGATPLFGGIASIYIAQTPG